MTANQVVAHNVARARALRGWTQEQAADALAPYLGARLSGPSFSGLERSAWTPTRVKQFSADDLLALSRGFDLPIGYFFTPQPPEADAGLQAPDAGTDGLDPMVLLDAILGTPANLGHWEDQLLAYAASTAPMPKSKRRELTNGAGDVAQRLSPPTAMRGRLLLRECLGETDDPADILERLAEVLRLVDETAAHDSAFEAVSGEHRGEEPKALGLPARSDGRRRLPRR